MPEDTDRKVYDKRVAQRYIRKGRLDEKDFERYLKGLPDLADQAVPVESDLAQEERPAEGGAAPVAPPPGEGPGEG